MKGRFIVIFLSIAGTLLFAGGKSDVQEPVASASPEHGVPGTLGSLNPDVAQALTQHAIQWDQYLTLVEYLEATGDRVAAADKALADGVISEEQAEIVKFMYNDSPQLDLATANSMENELLQSVGYTAIEGGYPIVDSNVTEFYGANGKIDEPKEGEPFYGQDANYQLTAADYTDNGDGTITDNVTGLMWESSPYQSKKFTWEEAMNGLDAFNEEKLGGYDDWRIPTLKELYSLVQFSGNMSMNPEEMEPFFDDDYFTLMDLINPGDRVIDVQTITSTIYDSQTLGGTTTMFGYNFRDAFVKGYPSTKTFTLYHVRGNTHYGQNLFEDNEDGTITDHATGLMWMTADSGWFKVGDVNNGTMNWEDALAWCENLEFAGYSDWRLPNAKELQSIVDYHRSPDTTDSAAIDPLFQATQIVNMAGLPDWGYYWTSTNFGDLKSIYLSFGRGMGMVGDYPMDVHGAGCQRADLRDGERSDFPFHDGPQGDEMRTYNLVRAVRTVE
ncbi:MAG: DUF1566 domain-containing protein [Spirochaetales bacterium]|nr:DUF1566 domain-containing protein [Spirochaetales bacterium]